jgi:hypothetical protein
MTTTESFTNNQLGQIIIDLALDKIKNWTKQEYRRIRSRSRVPLCIEINKNTWTIGNFVIRHQGTHIYRVDTTGVKVHIFYSRAAAIFYCALTTLNQFRLADKILYADQETARRYEDTEFYREKLNNRTTNLDDFKKLLYTTRYHESKLSLANAKRELEESLESAKYIKIWEDLL